MLVADVTVLVSSYLLHFCAVRTTDHAATQVLSAAPCFVLQAGRLRVRPFLPHQEPNARRRAEGVEVVIVAETVGRQPGIPALSNPPSPPTRSLRFQFGKT